MQESNKNIKNKIEQLQTYSSPIDLPLAWDALDRRMNRKKRRKILVWFWPLFLGLMATGYHYMSDTHSKDIQDVDVQKGVNLAHQNVIASSVPYLKEVGNKEHSPATEPSKISHALNEATHQTHTKTKISSSSNKQNQRYNQPINQRIESRNAKNNGLKKDITTAVLKPDHIVNEDKVHAALNPNEVEQDLKDIVTVDALQTKALHQIMSHVDQITISPAEYAIPVLHKSKPFFLDFRCMVGKPMYDFNAETVDMENIVAVRNKNEKSLESFSGHLSFGKEIGYQFYTSVGLSYQRIHDQWQSVRLDTQAISIENQVLEAYTNHQGNASQVLGTKEGRAIIKTTQTRFNTTEIFSGSWAIGRYFNISKMRWNVEAHIYVPFEIKYRGQVADQYGNLVALDQIYESKADIQYGIHTSYLYPVSGNLAIYGGFDYNFSKLKSHLGYFRTQHLHSLSLGMKYFIHQ
jgi:hypothetical protein